MIPSRHPSSTPSISPSDSPSNCKDSDGWMVGNANNSNPRENHYEGMTCDLISKSSNPEGYCEAIYNTPGSIYDRKSVRDAW